MRASTTAADRAPTAGQVLRGLALRLVIGPAAGLIHVLVWVVAVLAALVATARALQDLVWLLGVVGVVGGLLALGIAVAGALAG
jgi:hypothetical protein